MTWPADTFRHFWRHFAESAPWLLGGAVVGVALNRWIKTEWVERWMQTGRTPVIAATVAGGCGLRRFNRRVFGGANSQNPCERNASKSSSQAEEKTGFKKAGQTVTRMQRVTFSPGEFAALFGKSQTWGYRQIYADKVKTITEYGRILIPASEVDRILGTAGTYNGLKPKVAKKSSKLGGWRKFIEERRKAKTGTAKGTSASMTARLPAANANAREAALARLARKQNEKRVR